MAGLLNLLDNKLIDVDIEVTLDGPIGQLTNITSAVETLVNGTDVFKDIKNAVQDFAPSADLLKVDNLADVFSIPGATGLDAALGHILTPIENLLLKDFGGPGAGQILATIDLIREVMELATGSVVSGASAIPMASGVWSPQGMPGGDNIKFEDIREIIGKAEDGLDAFGENLDGEKIVGLIRNLAPRWSHLKTKWPQIPVIGDMFEAMGTVINWEIQTPDQITESFRQTIENTATLIASPRNLVANPVIANAAIVAGAKNTMSQAVNGLGPVMETLTYKITVSGHQPSANELTIIEYQITELEKLCQALDVKKSPLLSINKLIERLKFQLVTVVRTLHPSVDPQFIVDKVSQLTAMIPTADGAVFTEAVEAITNLDISAITDPIHGIKQAIDEAVVEVNGAKQKVKDELETALTPVKNTLDQMVSDAGISQIKIAFENLSTSIETLVQDNIMPVKETLGNEINDAVNDLAVAVGAFKPDEIAADMKNKIEEVASVFSTDDIAGVFGQVENALNQAIEVMENLDLTPAADESIALISEVESKVSSIDVSDIPDAAKPLLGQAVKIVTDIDFSAEISTPLVDEATDALASGPVALLDKLDDLAGQLKQRLDGFSPAVLIGSALQEPYDLAVSKLDDFDPSVINNLFDGMFDVLKERIHAVDADAVINPLVELHTQLSDAMAAFSPESLLSPFNDLVTQVTDKLAEISGLENVLGAITDIATKIEDYLDLMKDFENSLNIVAQKLQNPGDVETALDALVEAVLTRLDNVDMAALQDPFAHAAQAAELMEQPALTADLAAAIRSASDNIPGALTSDAALSLRRMVRDFPYEQLKQQRPVPSRKRLSSAMGRLNTICNTLENATDPWHELAPRLGQVASELNTKMQPYYQLTRLDGQSVVADFINPPTTNAELKDMVRESLRDSLKMPTTALFGLFAAVAPHVGMAAEGLSQIIGAMHLKLDGIIGMGGVAGTINSVNEAVEAITNINFDDIVIVPLNEAVYTPIDNAVQALNPEILRAPIDTAKDQIELILNPSIFDAPTEQLTQIFDDAVDALQNISISDLLDPLDETYGELLGAVMPVIELPAKLKELVQTAGRNLSAQILVELKRVEEAFDKMLMAIPFEADVNVSVSISI